MNSEGGYKKLNDFFKRRMQKNKDANVKNCCKVFQKDVLHFCAILQ